MDPPQGGILKIKEIKITINPTKNKDEIFIYGELDKRNYELCPYCNMWGSPKNLKKKEKIRYCVCKICERAWFDFIE